MDNIPGLVDANSGFDFDPARIKCPALSLVGEGEYADVNIQAQQKIFLDGVPHDKKALVVTPANEGASNHCLTENRSVMSQTVFDFLDEALENKLIKVHKKAN